MISLLLGGLFFLIGLAVGRISYSALLRPLFIYFPLAMFWSFKGLVSYWSILLYLARAILAIVAITIAVVLFPDFFNNSLISIGLSCGIGWPILDILFSEFGSGNTKRRLTIRFWHAMLKTDLIVKEHPLALEKIRSVLENEIGKERTNEVIRDSLKH